MTIQTQDELDRLRRVGRIVAETIRRMGRELEPGMTTRDLDEIGRVCLDEHGARSAPELTYQFPGATCISINDEAAHGVPSDRRIACGDLVNVDVSAELDGFYADSGASFPVGEVDERGLELCRFGKKALIAALRVLRAGVEFRELGRAVGSVARRGGFSVLENVGGHGLGRSLHADPRFIPFCRTSDCRTFEHGAVVAIEPFLSDGDNRVEQADDGWTLMTANGRRSVQFEHTVVVTDDEPIIIT
jgi:methionyl aminopeptidase